MMDRLSLAGKTGWSFSKQANL